MASPRVGLLANQVTGKRQIAQENGEATVFVYISLVTAIDMKTQRGFGLGRLATKNGYSCVQDGPVHIRWRTRSNHFMLLLAI